MPLKTPDTVTIFFGGVYLELSPGERIRYTDKFDDPKLPGEMVTTVTLRALSNCMAGSRAVIERGAAV